MFKIDSYGATVGNEFQDANAPTIPGTRVTAEWLNAVQREIIAILTAAGATPNKANDHQVVDAINYLISLGGGGGGGGGGGSPYWIDTVANTGLLPAGQLTGAIAYVITDNSLYRYNGSAWVKYYSAGDFAPISTAVTLTGTQTLTNKTLTSPSITTPSGLVKNDVGLGNVENAAASALYIPLTQKGAASGVVPLDSASLIPTMYLPPLAVVQYTPVANQAARLALTAQSGDGAIQADNGRTYVLKVGGVASTNADWLEISAGGAVSSVDGQTGAVSLAAVYQPLDADLTAVAALSTVGIVRRTGTGTFDTETAVQISEGGTGATTVQGAASAVGGMLPLIIAGATSLLKDKIYLVDTSAGSFTVTLPLISGGGRIRIIDLAGKWSTNALTVAVQSGDKIQGQAVNASKVFTVLNGWAEFYADATNTQWGYSTTIPGLQGAQMYGGYNLTQVSSAVTLINGSWYLTNTTSSAFTVTLPAGSFGMRIRISDDKETWDVNNLTINPATGESIGQNAVNIGLVCNVKRGWIDLAYDGGTWSILTLGSAVASASAVNGLTPVAVSTTVALAVNRSMYLCTSTGGFTITLPPVPSLGGVIGIMDANESCSATNYIRIAPATGQSINGYAVNDTLSLDYARANVVLYAAAGATSWKVQYQATSTVGPATGSQAGTISAEDSGSFSALISGGYSSNPSGTVFYKRTGQQVTLYLTTSITGISNGTNSILIQPGSLPTSIRPATSKLVPCAIMDNGSNLGGWAVINTDGSIGFYKDQSISANFTASAVKGITTLSNPTYTL